jgi:hypothetical protein
MIPEEDYADVAHIETSDECSVMIMSELLHVHLDAADRGYETGVTVVRDGGHLGLAAGVLDEDSEPWAKVSHSLEPEQARRLAAVLESAASETEEARERDPEPTGLVAFVRGLL